jgi:iron complex outermembrane receptor protein
LPCSRTIRTQGRYLIPNYQSQSYGGYFIEKWAKNRWDAQAGIRFDYKNIDTRRVRAGTQTLSAYSFNFSTLGSSINVGYKILPDWKTNATFSLATRAPHVNELLIDGIHHGTGTYERGNLEFTSRDNHSMFRLPTAIPAKTKRCNWT